MNLKNIFQKKKKIEPVTTSTSDVEVVFYNDAVTLVERCCRCCTNSTPAKEYDKKKYKAYEQYYGIKKFIGTYKGRTVSLAKKKERLLEKQKKLAGIKKDSEEYLEIKESIAENKKSIRQLEKFFRDNTQTYEKALANLEELKKELIV